MHLVEKENGILEYVADKDETVENEQFILRMAKYKLVRHGAGIYFFSKESKEDERLLLYANPFDNSIFVCDPSGYVLAAEFGMKRFPVGKARAELFEEKVAEVGAIQFSRDLLFPLRSIQEEKENEKLVPRVADLKELLTINKKNKQEVYKSLAELFNRCANFTPGKQGEYLAGGADADKFCRFNPINQVPHSSVVTDHVFLLDEKKKVGGTLAFTMILHPEGLIDVYLYDEIVDYFPLLQAEEQEQLKRLYENKEGLAEEKQKQAIAKIIEPKRLELMRPLFAAARKKITQTVLEHAKLSASEFEQQLETGKIHVFIRAADGRVGSYEQLGCVKKASDTLVIHGKATVPADMLVDHVKSWANQQLKQLSFSVSASAEKRPAVQNSYLNYGKVFTYTAALAALGVIAVKLWNRGSGGDALSMGSGVPQSDIFRPGKK